MLWTVAVAPQMHGRTVWVERGREAEGGCLPRQAALRLSAVHISYWHLKMHWKTRIFLRDNLNRGCLSYMLCSVLRQSFFLGSKGPSKRWSSHALNLLSWLALLVSFMSSFPQQRVFLRAWLYQERMKAGCTQAQSLELGSTRALMQYTGCNLLNWQPRTTGITPQSKSTLLLWQVLAVCCQPTSLVGPLTGEMHGVMLLLSNSQPLHINRNISLLLINHIPKLYNILRTAQDRSSMFFAEAFQIQIQPMKNV